MSMLEWWEAASYIVTVVGLPLAICVFMFEQRKERQNEEEEIYQRLSDEYADFLSLLLKNADLRLMSKEENIALTDEQAERKKIIFEILVSLFERAYILVYEDSMSAQTKRMWQSWEDYIRYWCRRKDFRNSLAELLQGEDPDFEKYMKQISGDSEKLGA